MVNMKIRFHNLSIRKTIVCYMIFFMILLLLLCSLTSHFCKIAAENIDDKYPDNAQQYFLATKDGKILGGEGTYIYNVKKEYSKEDEKLIKILEKMPYILNPIYSVICAILAIFLFYNNKLKKPLIELDYASKMIADNNLDFSIKYKSEDEMGRLCNSFETMRLALLENYKKMWRDVEERKELNTIFAHELRTPLTILKGYNEMLENSKDSRDKEIIKVMKKNIVRMEQYIETMNKMQKLEEITPNVKPIKTNELIKNINEIVRGINIENIKIDINDNILAQEIHIDLDMILQLINNLLSNAIQYANKLIKITINEDKENICIIVQDDGKGFSKKAIENATKPYYTENKENICNFGLGLYISKIYSELNNGKLEIYNANGACIKISLKKYNS